MRASSESSPSPGRYFERCAVDIRSLPQRLLVAGALLAMHALSAIIGGCISDPQILTQYSSLLITETSTSEPAAGAAVHVARVASRNDVPFTGNQSFAGVTNALGVVVVPTTFHDVVVRGALDRAFDGDLVISVSRGDVEESLRLPHRAGERADGAAFSVDVQFVGIDPPVPAFLAVLGSTPPRFHVDGFASLISVCDVVEDRNIFRIEPASGEVEFVGEIEVGTVPDRFRYFSDGIENCVYRAGAVNGGLNARYVVMIDQGGPPAVTVQFPICVAGEVVAPCE